MLELQNVAFMICYNLNAIKCSMHQSAFVGIVSTAKITSTTTIKKAAVNRSQGALGNFGMVVHPLIACMSVFSLIEKPSRSGRKVLGLRLSAAFHKGTPNVGHPYGS